MKRSHEVTPRTARDAEWCSWADPIERPPTRWTFVDHLMVWGGIALLIAVPFFSK
jgi:hypothetical protein